VLVVSVEEPPELPELPEESVLVVSVEEPSVEEPEELDAP